jgi:hypothetical protein
LPVSFIHSTQEDVPQETIAPGRNMMVAFHRSVLNASQVRDLPSSCKSGFVSHAQ